MYFSPQKQKFIDAATDMFGDGVVLDKQGVRDASAKAGVPLAGWFMKSYKVGYNQFKLPSETQGVVQTNVVSEPEVQTTVNLVATNMESQNLVPSPFEGFVPWGHHSTIKQIVKSGLFYPVFVTGLSGNGKTLMIEQIHAEMKKELIRVNITIETDEDDLLGGFRLVNGETKFVPGPVIEAMERGCTLLLDECDLGSNKLMALQPVLEGKGVFLKKVNKWVTPKDGFNVIATANTKGKGSEDGRFIGTNILNEAFLERFPITVEQENPSMSVERKILDKVFGSLDVDAGDFSERLVTWADIIRKTFYEGGIDEIIATRRLVHIANAYAIFGDRKKAIEMCIARFDEDTKTSFLDLYSKVDEEVSNAMANEAGVESETKSDDADDLTPF